MEARSCGFSVLPLSRNFNEILGIIIFFSTSLPTNDDSSPPLLVVDSIVISTDFKRKMVRKMNGSLFYFALITLCSLETSNAFAPLARPSGRTVSTSLFSTTEEETATSKNVAQTQDTNREKIMTFSYDMSLEPKYEKPTYPGTGNGLSGDAGEYDVIVIGSGMGGLSCGAISAKYGDKVLVLESHIKCGGSAHTFSRMHKGGKYSFEVGPSIFEGLDRPSLNPLRMIFDLLGEDMPVETYTGLGYWTPTGYWRFPIGSQQKFEDLLMEQAEDGPKAVKVSIVNQCRRLDLP